METKYCNHCKKDHLATKEFWTGKKFTQCKQYLRDWRKYKRTPEARKQAYIKGLEWRKNNPEQWKVLTKKHYQKNSKKIIQRNYEYAAKRRKTDVNYNLTIILRQRFNKALKSGYKVGSAVKDLGCTIEEFRTYIESKWQVGMSWENHTRDGWHIDHIIPISSFNLSDPEQAKQACHYTNLQPLWSEDNFSKGDKLA